MAEIKVTQLPTATNIARSGDTSPSNDWFMIIQNGANKKIQYSTILSKLNKPVIVNSNKEGITFTVHGNGSDNLFKVFSGDNKVGISVAAPEEKLHVGGNLKVNNLIINSVEYVTSKVSNRTATSGNLIAFGEELTAAGGGTAQPDIGHNASTRRMLSPSTTCTSIATRGNFYCSLGAGNPGQEKFLTFSYAHNASDMVDIDFGATGNGFDTIQLKRVGDGVSLVYVSHNVKDMDIVPTVNGAVGGWVITGLYGSAQAA